MKMDQHITLVATLNIVFGAIGIVIGIFLFAIITGAGIISGEPEAMTILSIVGMSLGGFIIITSIPEIIGGIGLLKRKGWARILLIIISCLDLLEIPFGTAIGIYSLWVLLNEETTAIFSKQNEIAASN